MASCPAFPVERPNAFRDGLLHPDGGSWPLTAKRDENSFPIPHLPTISRENVWPNVHVDMPEKLERKRNNDLADIAPKIAVLKRMGIREPKKLAKIIYSLHPFLSHGEIGALFPANPKSVRNKATDRDRGRVLLGLKAPRKSA